MAFGAEDHRPWNCRRRWSLGIPRSWSSGPRTWLPPWQNSCVAFSKLLPLPGTSFLSWIVCSLNRWESGPTAAFGGDDRGRGRRDVERLCGFHSQVFQNRCSREGCAQEREGMAGGGTRKGCKVGCILFYFLKILFLSNLYTQYGAQTYNPWDQAWHALLTEPARCPGWVFF